MARIPQDIPIQLVIKALLDESALFPPKYLPRFSDLEGTDLRALQQAWPRVNPTRRIALMEDLEELTESDTMVDFDHFAVAILHDNEPAVRANALRLLWENDNPKLASRFIEILEKDLSPDVRAAAASALGKYIFLGELEEISNSVLHRVEEALFKAAGGADDALVRRHAIESLGFSSRDDVPPLIRAAYDTNDPDWVASALYAMGRSYDQQWENDVKRMLRNPKANVQLEAVRAAGELELSSTERIILDLLEEEAQDPEIRFAVIWSLSQIGGEVVRETLEKLLEESEDEDETEWLNNAIDNLTITETGQSLNILDIDLKDKELLGTVIDLSKPVIDDGEDDLDIDEEIDEEESPD
jgi:HEAT repeat protein